MNLVFPYDGLRKDNVTSTMRVLHLAMDHKVKPVTYVSTDAVFPMAGGPHAEDGADLLETLGSLENGYSQSKAVAELLVKLAKGNVDLFRGAVAALAPADVALVQAAMGKAIKRAAAPPTRLAPPPRASPGGGGLKLNMSQYR